MKEVKLIELKNKVDALTNIIRQLLKDTQKIDVLARGTITAFQLHIGEKKWDKLVDKMKDIEKKQIKETKEKIKVKKKKFETLEDVE